jgi:CrcB protein
MLTKALLVGLGGFLGAIARFGISNISKNWLVNYPFGTLIANLIGSFLLGALMFGVFNHKLLTDSYRLLLVVGFCGSLTTMSTFALDTVELSSMGQMLSAALYFVITTLGCIAVVFLAKALFS